jgi:outer membrane protein assembly factor BamB
MYKLVKYEPDIIDFNFFSNKLLYIDTARNLHVAGKIYEKVELSRYCQNDNYLYYYGSRGNNKFYIINMQTNKIDVSDNFFAVCKYFDYSFCPVYFDYKFIEHLGISHKTGLYDYSSETLIKEYETLGSHSVIYYDKEKIFSYDDEKIFSIDAENENIIWSYKLDNNSKIKNTFSEYNNQLLFQIDDDKILSIDIETGKLINQWQAKNDASATMAKDTFPCGMKLDINAGKLLHPYVEIDIQSKEYKNLDILSQLEISPKEEFIIYPNTDFSFNDEYMFISATQHSWIHKGKPPKSTCHLFAMNRKTGKQEWHHELNSGKNYKAVKKIEVTNNELYVLDHGNTLHIFEK